jgi:hypothetical protein
MEIKSLNISTESIELVFVPRKEEDLSIAGSIIMDAVGNNYCREIDMYYPILEDKIRMLDAKEVQYTYNREEGELEIKIISSHKKDSPKEKYIDKLQFASDTLDKINRGYDYITEDGKVYDFTVAEKNEMVKKAINALAEVAFYINGGI